jgi:hypothetical protein
MSYERWARWADKELELLLEIVCAWRVRTRSPGDDQPEAIHRAIVAAVDALADPALGAPPSNGVGRHDGRCDGIPAYNRGTFARMAKEPEMTRLEALDRCPRCGVRAKRELIDVCDGTYLATYEINVCKHCGVYVILGVAYAPCGIGADGECIPGCAGASPGISHDELLARQLAALREIK